MVDSGGDGPSITTHAPVLRLPSGTSRAVADVVKLLKQVAGHDSNVLILGESGTGKEVVARAIHESSSRRRGPFVAVNCGAIPAELLESELFGHEKGSFTGAYAARKGRFEIADGGTLFLDEIGDMSLPMQVKLLRVLQERVFERVGNHVPVTCNVRIVAATHRNLDELVLRGQFRGDLFYRLNVFPIEMPSLHERIEDLEVLIGEFNAENAAAGRVAVAFTPAALAALRAHPWPGNVRELANLVERLCILHGGHVVDVMQLPVRYRGAAFDPGAVTPHAPAATIPLPAPPVAVRAMNGPDSGLSEAEALDLRALPDAAALAAAAAESAPRLPPEGMDLRTHLFAIEQSLIRQAIERSGGTVARAARLLGLRRTTLVEKLRKFGIDAADSLTED